METLGTKLKNKRIALKLSINEVADKIRVRNKYLIQIEEDNVSKDNIYVFGYIKNYAQFLKVDIEDELKNNAKGQESDDSKKIDATLADRESNKPSIGVVLISLSAIVVSAFFLIYLKNMDFSDIEIPQEIKKIPQEKVEVTKDETKNEVSEKVQVNKINSFQFEVSEISKDNILVITANQNVEVSVFDVEGELVVRKRLEKGEVYSFEGNANKRLRFITNAPNAIEFKFAKPKS